MKNRDIAIFVNARQKSRRCPNKLLKPFAGTTLIDICLNKLSKIDNYPIYFAAYENEFINKANKFDNITIIKRSGDSAYSDSDAKKIFEALNNIPSEYVAWLNPCHPFLKEETFISAIEFFLKNKYITLTAVKKNKGWFYAPDGKPLNNKNLVVDTVFSEWIYEVVHCFHIYPRKYMLENGKPWDNQKMVPFLYEISEEESWDIDTEEDFIMVEALYKKL